MESFIRWARRWMKKKKEKKKKSMKRRLGKSSSLYEIILYEFDGLKTHYMSASYFMEHFYSMRY